MSKSQHKRLNVQTGKPMMEGLELERRLPYAYPCGNNPAGDGATYYCHRCGLELQGRDVGFVAAGTEYANGEHSPCPKCGEENAVDRDADGWWGE